MLAVLNGDRPVDVTRSSQGHAPRCSATSWRHGASTTAPPRVRRRALRAAAIVRWLGLGPPTMAAAGHEFCFFNHNKRGVTMRIDRAKDSGQVDRKLRRSSPGKQSPGRPEIVGETWPARASRRTSDAPRRHCTSSMAGVPALGTAGAGIPAGDTQSESYHGADGSWIRRTARLL